MTMSTGIGMKSSSSTDEGHINLKPNNTGSSDFNKDIMPVFVAGVKPFNSTSANFENGKLAHAKFGRLSLVDTNNLNIISEELESDTNHENTFLFADKNTGEFKRGTVAVSAAGGLVNTSNQLSLNINDTNLNIDTDNKLDLNSDLEVTSINTDTFTASGLIKANAGIETTNVYTSGLIKTNTGIETTGYITAYGDITTNNIITANGGIQTTNVNTTGDITSNGGIVTSTLEASDTIAATGSITANGGIVTTTLLASDTITATGLIKANGGIQTTNVDTTGSITADGDITSNGELKINGDSTIIVDNSKPLNITNTKGTETDYKFYIQRTGTYHDDDDDNDGRWMQWHKSDKSLTFSYLSGAHADAWRGTNDYDSSNFEQCLKITPPDEEQPGGISTSSITINNGFTSSSGEFTIHADLVKMNLPLGNNGKVNEVYVDVDGFLKLNISENSNSDPIVR